MHLELPPSSISVLLAASLIACVASAGDLTTTPLSKPPPPVMTQDAPVTKVVVKTTLASHAPSPPLLAAINAGGSPAATSSMTDKPGSPPNATNTTNTTGKADTSTTQTPTPTPSTLPPGAVIEFTATVLGLPTPPPPTTTELKYVLISRWNLTAADLYIAAWAPQSAVASFRFIGDAGLVIERELRRADDASASKLYGLTAVTWAAITPAPSLTVQLYKPEPNDPKQLVISVTVPFAIFFVVFFGGCVIATYVARVRRARTAEKRRQQRALERRRRRALQGGGGDDSTLSGDGDFELIVPEPDRSSGHGSSGRYIADPHNPYAVRFVVEPLTPPSRSRSTRHTVEL